MTASMGVGAVIGGLYTAGRGKTGLASLVRSSMLFAVVIAAAAIAPNLALEIAALAAVGGASVAFLSKGNTTLQLAAAPHMRGRVMALWAVAFLGSTPIGGPVIGWVTALSGARVGLAVGALSCFVAAGLGLFAIRHLGRRTQAPSPRGLETSSRAA
jgi:MFS family permease